MTKNFNKMPYTAEYVKEKLTKELEATHVVRRGETSASFAYLMAAIGVLVRWAVALHSYSGQGQAPIYGDYEAQRHWQEITLNLPASEWYRNSTRNDLNYWGLDYPPLTAYHSLALGYIARQFNPEFVELGDSRGFESPEHKLFMRWSSLLADVVVLLPALVLSLREQRSSSLALACLYPGLILIDHGHFQYNSVCLGLTLWAVLALRKRRVALAACLFSLALNYKQIALYHALPFFCYLLGQCWRQPSWSGCARKLTVIATSVILTFLVVWFPFLNSKDAMQVLHRVFPVARGLYEDKVASFWCAISPVFKPQNYLAQGPMAAICAAVTLLAALPSCLNLLRHPGQRRFELCLLNTSLAFFLFSYHVHEKSILFAALPALLLLPSHPLSACTFLWISSFSLLQLACKDGLVLAWSALQLLFLGAARALVPVPRRTRLPLGLSMAGSGALAIAYALVSPPARYPDLFPLLLAVFCCLHFFVFLAYFTREVVDLSDGCGAKFNVIVVSPKFAGKPLLQQQRCVSQYCDIIIQTILIEC
ncbi:hypothetical protein B566_EDAN012034 [Ephemera danica]|nr:hypothetical protein B566_EDAN012034 [Ephemera danica]